MQSLRRGVGLKDVDRTAKDTYETVDDLPLPSSLQLSDDSDGDSDMSDTTRNTEDNARAMALVRPRAPPPPLPDRVLVVHSAVPINPASINAAAALAAASEPDHSGRIKDIPRPLVLVGGRSTNVLAALTPSKSFASSVDPLTLDHKSPLDSDESVAYFAKDGKLGKLARLIAEARALEVVVSALKKKDDQAESIRKAAEEEEMREKERLRRERAMDAWLHMESSDEEEVQKAPPPKPPRRGVTNAQILEGILGLQVTLASVGETIKDSSQISKLLYRPTESEATNGMGFFDEEFVRHLEIGPKLLAKLDAIADEEDVDDSLIYADQIRHHDFDKSITLATNKSPAHKSGKLVTFQLPAETSGEVSRSALSPLQPIGFNSASKDLNATSLVPQPPPMHPQSGSTIHYQILNLPESPLLAQIEKHKQLEDRITALERHVGLHYLKLHDTSATTIHGVLQQSGSVMGALDRLDHQLAILSDPQVMRGTMVAEVSDVCVQMRKLIDGRRIAAKQIDGMSNGFGTGNRLLKSLQRRSRIAAAVVAAAEGDIDAEGSGEDTADNLAQPDTNLPSLSKFDSHEAKLKRISAKLQPKVMQQDSILADFKRQTKETETEKRVNHLYSRLHSMERVVTQLPYLVLRLQGLSAVHERANELSERINRLLAEQAKTVDAVRGAEGLVKTVEDGLHANEIAFMVNFESLETRLIDIVDRVQRGY
ncbi:hypothetical protein HDU83_007655 [Entophlyctis luteolus]|nr:hypothetical protein HDU83_007655 [Entophlyctis luteolus]KAJ3377978.1 hypothetical protein HDU84_008042 [Entophlyctis sp. JEL0112]